MNGIDTPYSALRHARQLADAGYAFVVRYISPDTHNFPNKRLTAAEVTGLHGAGLTVGCVWETGNTADLFTTQNGEAHGKAATSVSLKLSQPAGSAIYFAVDLDVDQETLDRGVTAYFTAIRSIAAGDGYKVGVYGSGQVCKHLSNLGLVEFKWLSQSMGWSQSATYEDWDMKQGPSKTVAGMDCDTDETKGSAGLW